MYCRKSDAHFLTGVEGTEEGEEPPVPRCPWREEGGGGGRRGNPPHCFVTGVVGADLLVTHACAEDCTLPLPLPTAREPPLASLPPW